jgi:mono/diheme cytochrome c family protein
MIGTRIVGIGLSVLALAGTVLAWDDASRPAQRATAAAGPSLYKPVLDKYCVSCHNERLKTAGLMLDKMDWSDVPAGAEVWEKVVRKVRAGMMPPAGMPRPDQATADGLVSFLESTLDKAALAHPNPGRALMRRVNRAEYANAVRDLLSIDIDVTSLLPPDDSGYGFDNIADLLGVSPVLLERYLSAAMKIGPLAVGDTETGPVEETYRAPADLNQTQHVEGLPFGTRGGLLIRHTFPADGEYLIKATLWRNNAGRVRGLESPHQLEISVDGERVHLVTLGTPEQFADSFQDRTNSKLAADFDAQFQVRVPVKAGPRTVGVTFLAKSAAQDPQKLQPLLSPFDAVDTHGVPRVDAVMITGPYKVTGPGDTPSRRRVFVCRPASASEETPCARKIITTLARRAYRRPVTGADLELLLGFYRDGRRDGSFDTGIERVLIRLLASPEFVFRVERDPDDAAPGSLRRVTDLELATRLSSFLWSSIPDDALLEAASEGKLKDPRVLEREVRRMIADPKGQALVGNFAGQWLYLRNLRTTAPITDEFPDFDDDLRQAFLRETQMLFESVVREDRNVLDLMNADYTFVNERLAKHYGIPDVYGSRFRRVPVRDEARRGLLGQGSFLTVTSNANRTSPVKRGKWILENVLGTPPPPPPPNVPPLKENSEREQPLSMRQQMEQHRASPACASCHKLMDPVGFSLENFDGVGAWRTKDADNPIDTAVELYDGAKIDGPIALRQWIMRHPEIFVRTVTEKLMTYALGRGLAYYDMPAVRAIVREQAQQGYRFSSIVMGIVKNTAFQMRMKGSEETTQVAVK